MRTCVGRAAASPKRSKSGRDRKRMTYDSAARERARVLPARPGCVCFRVSTEFMQTVVRYGALHLVKAGRRRARAVSEAKRGDAFACRLEIGDNIPRDPSPRAQVLKSHAIALARKLRGASLSTRERATSTIRGIASRACLSRG